MYSKTTIAAYARMKEMLMDDFPTQPLPEESNEAFAERKRKWARENSERILQQKWIDYPYLPEDINEQRTIRATSGDAS